MSNGRKDHWVQIRISREDEDIIKKSGMTKTEIWRLGFNLLPEKLKEQAEYHRKLSIQCIDKFKELKEIEINKINSLDKFCRQYIEFERTIPQELSDLPSQDRNWIEAKIKNHKLQCDVNGFLIRCKELMDSNGNTQDSPS